MDKEQGTKLSSKTDARVGLKLENRPEDWQLAPIQGDTQAVLFPFYPADLAAQ
jgi:hypothetical protein